jgi:hypothetical protein
MQDSRVRLGSAAVLSVAAFISITGACAVFLWWLVFTPHMRSVRTRSVIPGMLALIGFVAILIVISGGNGFSYFVRMAIVLFIGTWLYAEQKPGDFLSVSVWVFGKRAGFDMGMVGECAIQMAESLSYDLTRIQTAMKLKRQVWGIKNLVPAGLVLINDTMVRASDITELLAARGYREGGTLCPVFSTSTRDLLAGICAICAFIFAIIPVSEFFILYR